MLSTSPWCSWFITSNCNSRPSVHRWKPLWYRKVSSSILEGENSLFAYSLLPMHTHHVSLSFAVHSALTHLLTLVAVSCSSIVMEQRRDWPSLHEGRRSGACLRHAFYYPRYESWLDSRTPVRSTWYALAESGYWLATIWGGKKSLVTTWCGKGKGCCKPLSPLLHDGAGCQWEARSDGIGIIPRTLTRAEPIDLLLRLLGHKDLSNYQRPPDLVVTLES